MIKNEVATFLKRIAILLGALTVCAAARAYDCSAVEPFPSLGVQSVKVIVARFVWNEDEVDDEDVCSVSTSINVFDVRGREEEAYYCLKPSISEVISCQTKLNNEEAEISILPASWIRHWNKDSAREYRFHAYVVKRNDSDFYYDLFSRSLYFDLNSRDITLEGSLRTGHSNQQDGFWVRAEFQVPVFGPKLW